MGHTVIQVPVPEVEVLVRPRVLAAHPGIGALDDTTVCAHITLLGPFVHRGDVTTELLATLQGLMGSVAAFRFELSTVARFASGLVYLPPKPAAPFKGITAMLAAAFPDWPPYGGAFIDVVPHVSMGVDLSASDLESVKALLPVRARADQVALTWWSDDTITTLATFELQQR